MTSAWRPDSPSEPANGYIVRHGVAHLLAACRRIEAATRLGDLTFAGAWIRWCRQHAHDDFTPVMRAWRVVGNDQASRIYAAEAGRVAQLAEGDLEAARLLVEFLDDAGFAVEAIAIGERLLERHRALFGAEDAATASAERVVGLVLKAQGRCGDAEPLLEHALLVHAAKLAWGDAERFATMNGCASLRAALGRFDEAIALFQQTLEGRREVLGPKHPRTLVTLASLGAALTDAGRHAEAVPIHREVLEDRKALLGSDHPKTLTSMANLGRALTRSGQPAPAIVLLEDLVARRDRILGPSHARSVNARRLLEESRRACLEAEARETNGGA